MSYTKGEWKVRFMGNKNDGENMFFVEAPNLNMPNLGYGIEILQDDFGEHNGYPRDQRLCDAKLIAAAPDLLETLKECRDVLVMLSLIDKSNTCDKMTEKVEAAIKKAVG